MKFGLIPELVGRIPIIVPLNDLDKNALVRILSEPKNSLLKQYRKMFEMDGVTLIFDDDALEAIATEAIQRNTGARGLRSIMESAMLHLMYEVPSREDVSEIVIHADCIKGLAAPKYVLKELVSFDPLALPDATETSLETE